VSVGTVQGETPSPSHSRVTVTPSGVFAATNASTASMIFAGCCAPTSRNDSLA
jgi:hypothetical protein